MGRRNWIWLALALCLVSATAGYAADGQETLDKAVDAKLNAKSTAELTKVINLAEKAISEGLEPDGVEFANNLLASSYYQRGAAMAQQAVSNARDKSWVEYRKLALADLERSAKLQPKSVDTHMLIGKLNGLPGGDRERAAKAFDEAAKLAESDSERAEALLLRTGLEDKLEKRLESLDEVIKLVPKDPRPLRTRGALYMQQNEPQKALDDFDAAIKIDGDDAATYEARGMALATLKQLDKAKESLDQAAKLAPKSANTLVQRGRINMLNGEFDNAVADATKALELEPNNPGALLVRSQAQLQAGKLDEALADVNAVLSKYGNLALALKTRALVYAADAKMPEAIADLEKVIEQEPEDSSTMLQLGLMETGAKQYAQAEQTFDRVLKLDKKNWMALRGRGDALLSQGKQAEAITNYNEALEAQPKDSGILNNLAWVLATSTTDSVRDGKRAIELATAAAEATEHKQPHILSTLAAAYAETGDFDSAIKWSKQAVELGSDEMKDELRKELKSYEDHKPWRETLSDVDKPEQPKAANKTKAKPKKVEKEKPAEGDSEESGPKL